MLHLALASLALLPPALIQERAPGLAALPQEPALSLYSPQVSLATAAALESPWVRFFAEGPGRANLDLLLGLGDELGEEPEQALAVVAGLRDVLLAADGAGLCYLERGGLGLVLSGGEGQAGTNLSLDRWLASLSADWQVEAVELGAYRGELWSLDGEAAAPIGRVRGSELSAIYVGEDEQAVRAGLLGLLERGAGEAASPAALRIRERVKGAAPRLVMDLDLERLAAWVAEDDPTAGPLFEQLGLAQENLLILDTHESASGVHQVGSWQFGDETGIARMMDSFQPIEMSQVRTLPAETSQFSLLRWQPMELLETILSMAPPQVAQGWSDVREASVALLGMDVETDLLAQLDGEFSAYVAPNLDPKTLALDPLQGWSLQIGLKDGAAAEDFLSKLIQSSAAEGALELDSFGEFDVWGLPEELQQQARAPRLVFTERALLVLNAAESLEDALAPFGSESVPTLADGAGPVVELRAQSGAFYFSYQDQAAAVGVLLAELQAVGEMMGLPAGPAHSPGELRSWFPGVFVSSARRTSRGVSIRASVH
jgi:hypothetical protein